jgi:hypothetical protein
VLQESVPFQPFPDMLNRETPPPWLSGAALGEHQTRMPHPDKGMTHMPHPAKGMTHMQRYSITDTVRQANLNTALQWAEAGYPVFPCRPDKRPLVKDWQARATTDTARLRHLVAQVARRDARPAHGRAQRPCRAGY